ncbi:MAG: outer membrane protein [Acidobacteriota bacterium]|jgi:HAE1 family hydrophobic/amphiphilic exporter-1|nr:outer membrane protein [Acidobacteriota bacterium]
MTVRRLITTILLSLAATTLGAQTATPAPAPRTTETVTAETDQDVNNARAMRLSLDQAMQLAMERNLGIQVQRYESQMAGESLRAEYGIFDWFGSATVRQAAAENPTTSTFQASSSRSTTYNFGVSQFLPTGGTYTVGFDNSRVTQAGGGTFINPAFNTDLGATLTQPLLRDFGLDVNRRGITIARNTLGITDEAFRLNLMNTAVSVEQAYLDLIYARRAVDVVKESLFLARDQSRITQIRIDVGASAPLDILQPRVTIATSEEQLILAVANVRNAEDRLRALMNLEQSEWDRPIVPTDPVEYAPLTVDATSAVAQALQLRPELRQQNLSTETLKVQYLYAHNQTLPTLDLALGYNLSGIAGTTLDRDPTTGQTIVVNRTRYFDALGQIGDRESPQWNIGFNIGLPFTNIGARAVERRTQLDLEQSRTSLAQLQQNISVEVRGAARDVETSARTIAATRTAREAAEQNVQAERRRYENGMTTNFQVLQVQQQLSDARIRELQALVGYNQAVSNYHRVVGDILQVHNISVNPPARADEPKMFLPLDRYNWLNYGSRVKNLEEQPK